MRNMIWWNIWMIVLINDSLFICRYLAFSGTNHTKSNTFRCRAREYIYYGSLAISLCRMSASLEWFFCSCSGSSIDFLSFTFTFELQKEKGKRYGVGGCCVLVKFFRLHKYFVGIFICLGLNTKTIYKRCIKYSFLALELINLWV